MLKLYSSVNFAGTAKSKTLPDIDAENASEVGLAIAKMIQDNEDLGAANFTWTLVMPEKEEPEIEIVAK